MIGSCALPAALAAALLMSHAVAAAPDEGAEFAVPHQRVDVGGRKLNLYCSGEGAPVVVFESPHGYAGWVWFKVVPEVARHSRACVYDRAGFGFSDASPKPGDSASAVDDLHALLKAAAIPGPYLLVGSSFGAMNVQLYALRYPTDIAGLLLVDGQSEIEMTMLDLVTGEKFSKAVSQELAFEDGCSQGAAAGKLSDECSLEKDTGAGSRLLAAVEKERHSPAYWQAIKSAETNYTGASSQELHQARQNFGEYPFLILARSVSPYQTPDQPPSPFVRAIEDVHKASLEAILASAPKGEMRVVPDAAHYIQLDQPKAVSDAILELLGRVRDSAGKGEPH